MHLLHIDGLVASTRANHSTIIRPYLDPNVINFCESPVRHPIDQTAFQRRQCTYLREEWITLNPTVQLISECSRRNHTPCSACFETDLPTLWPSKRKRSDSDPFSCCINIVNCPRRVHGSIRQASKISSPETNDPMLVSTAPPRSRHEHVDPVAVPGKGPALWFLVLFLKEMEV